MAALNIERDLHEAAVREARSGRRGGDDRAPPRGARRHGELALDRVARDEGQRASHERFSARVGLRKYDTPLAISHHAEVIGPNIGADEGDDGALAAAARGDCRPRGQAQRDESEAPHRPRVSHTTEAILTAVVSIGIPLGPYLLVKRLARGGMAEIFLARKEGPEGFSRDLVVKRILPHLAADPEFTSMFLEEARIAARLTHPNVVQVYDFGEVDGTYYLVMELVRGIDLRALISRAAEKARAAGRPGAIPPHHAAKIMSFVCEGLAHAHSATIDDRSAELVHRDMTPSNVLISFEGSVKVADFGIAKAERASRRELTRLGVVKGKRAYMSPEQARGERLDARSDLFSIGILLYEAITGVPLFPHDDLRAAMTMIAAGRIPGEQHLASAPAQLAAVIRRALAPKREDRYPDALALRAELEAFLRNWPDHSDAIEIAGYIRRVFPDMVAEDGKEVRAAGTVPVTLAYAGSGSASPGVGHLAAIPEGIVYGSGGSGSSRPTTSTTGRRNAAELERLFGEAVGAPVRTGSARTSAPGAAPAVIVPAKPPPIPTSRSSSSTAARSGSASTDAATREARRPQSARPNGPGAEDVATEVHDDADSSDQTTPPRGVEAARDVFPPMQSERVEARTVPATWPAGPSGAPRKAAPRAFPWLWAGGAALAFVAIAVIGIVAFAINEESPPGEPPSDPATMGAPPIGPGAPAPPGELRVRSEPPGLQVAVEGRVVEGATPAVYALPSNRDLRISLLRDGSPIAHQTVRLAPRGRQEIVLRAPEQAVSTGTLRIVTTPPGAEVRTGSALLGHAPLSVPIEPGDHDIEIVLDGYVSHRETVSIAGPAATAMLSVVLQREPTRRHGPSGGNAGASPAPAAGSGTLAISTTPWSQVYLGNRLLGTTPLTNVRLPAGRHTLTLRAPGRPPRAKTIVIEPDHETRVRETL